MNDQQFDGLLFAMGISFVIILIAISRCTCMILDAIEEIKPKQPPQAQENLEGLKDEKDC